MSRDRPALRMVVGLGGVLKPADAYSERKMMGFQPGREIEIRPVPDVTYWKRKRYFQILDLVIERCNTKWKSSEEAHEILKVACGLIKIGVHPNPAAKAVVYAGSTKDLLDPEFDRYYDRAMAWLYEYTGVEPETLEREVGGADEQQEHDLPGVVAPAPGEEGDGSPTPPSPAAVAGQQEHDLPEVPQPSSGEEGDGSLVPPGSAAVADHQKHDLPAGMLPSSGEAGDGSQKGPPSSAAVADQHADEPAMVNSAKPMSTAVLKEEAIRKVLALVQDPALNDQQRRDILAKTRALWTEKLSGHPDFIKVVFETAWKVMKGELPMPAAQKYLFMLKDGG